MNYLIIIFIIVLILLLYIIFYYNSYANLLGKYYLNLKQYSTAYLNNKYSNIETLNYSNKEISKYFNYYYGKEVGENVLFALNNYLINLNNTLLSIKLNTSDKDINIKKLFVSDMEIGVLLNKYKI